MAIYREKMNEKEERKAPMLMCSSQVNRNTRTRGMSGRDVENPGPGSRSATSRPHPISERAPPPVIVPHLRSMDCLKATIQEKISGEKVQTVDGLGEEYPPG